MLFLSIRASSIVSGLFLIAAGVYQFLPLKAACLTRDGRVAHPNLQH